MSSEPGAKSNKVLWIVLIVLGGLFVVCLGCAGVGGFIWYKSKDTLSAVLGATVASQGFMQALQRNDVDGAYDLTSKAYQARQSREQFKAFIDKNPGLKGHQTHNLTAQNPADLQQSMTFKGVVSASGGGSINCTLKVAKEGENWKVDDFTVP